LVLPLWQLKENSPMLRIFAFIALALTAVTVTATQFVPEAAQAKTHGWQTYSAKSFTAAQNAGKTIVVDVYADWCPTCRAQAPILDELRAQKASKDTIFMKVNVDNNRAFMRTHRIPRQSTILVFKGKKEVARSIAQTNRTKLRSVVLGAL
jgi:thiol:disulfide interchange protein